MATVAPRDVWVADRHFCTTGLLGIAKRKGLFVIRRHASILTWERESGWKQVGRTDTGTPAEDGDLVIELVTNLPAEAACALVAKMYRSRWTVEALFGRLTTVLKCEVNTLGYPSAALFGFCVALAGGNVYAGVKGALRSVYGWP